MAAGVHSCLSSRVHVISLSCVTSVVDDTESLAIFDISMSLSSDAETTLHVALELTFTSSLQGTEIVSTALNAER
jgi:hypothetical protein